MLVIIWISSDTAAKELGISPRKLSYFRETGLLKPGIHWKSSPYGQKKPWNPQPLYNIKLCRQLIKKTYLKDNENIAA